MGKSEGGSMTDGEDNKVIKLSKDTGPIQDQIQANLETLTATLSGLTRTFFGNLPTDQTQKITKLVLGAGVRAIQRGAEDWKDIQQTAHEIARVVKHDYLSSACHHQEHKKCLGPCDICASACTCTCHKGV